ncbi:MAG: hypothetical protein WBQ48_01490 [Aeromicrobium sp.]
MRLRWFVILGLIAAGILVSVAVRDRTPMRSEFCQAQVGAVRAQVDLEQAQWATLMAAIAQQRGLPPRATTIAIATAFQESKLRNIDFGDRDSLGLFQQRPSQGWGTAEQVLDPYHSIGAFYDGLVKVKDYETLQITDAAQRVQRSAFPRAYAQHEEGARALASALRGYSPAAFTCQINPGNVRSIQRAADDVLAAFGDIDVQVLGDDASYRLTGPSADIEARGWGVAHYLVGHAADLGISRVTFDDRTWTAGDSDDGWQPSPTRRDDTVIFSTN